MTGGISQPRGQHQRVQKENDMGYYSSNAYRDFKWFEKMEKERNIGKRNFKQIDKVHRKNKMKKR